MRATRAYIASAGTAVVMLGASLVMFALVSGFVAFGSWPGAKEASRLDQVGLNEVVHAKGTELAVRPNAGMVPRRAEQRRAAEAKKTQAREIARIPAGTPV